MDLKIRFLAAVAICCATPAVAQQITPVVVGPNVNMVGGPASFTPPSTIVGDPFLQRQNEPSLAVSSRNACHLLAGANDYRLVDLEQALCTVDALGDQQCATGDAWLGVFKSLDCGNTWTSTVLAGNPLDTSADGLASPIKGLPAAADPTVRAGTSGLFYYSGIAFDRVSNLGKVFVARFVDKNNADGADPFKYLDTTAIDTGTSGQFLDKPWIATDVPRAGAGTCSIDGKTVPAGNVYLLYTTFVGGTNNVHSKIMFSRSVDCGATWSNPAKLSESIAKNQGTTIAVDPGTGVIYVAWRSFTDPADATAVNGIVVAKSTDGGKSFTKGSLVQPVSPVTGLPYRMVPFDQASSAVTFRTNAYPTIAVAPAEAEGRPAGQPGRVYLAWSARGFAPLRANQTQGDARVVYSTSLDGSTWTYPRSSDNYPGAGHQIMPIFAFAGGRLALAYYDLREDSSATFDDLVVEYGQAALNACTASLGPTAPFGTILQCMVANPTAPRRHTLDLRAAMADAQCLSTGACSFTSYSVVGGGSRRVSKYVSGRARSTGLEIQLQYNRPNLPLFSKGRLPFIGDYIDIAGESFVTDASGVWQWNTGQTANRPAPVFHVTWGDNRNVKRPGDANWEHYTPVVPGPNGLSCTAGQAGDRNQDVYTAELRPGLALTAPLNAKKVLGLQRSFVVVAQNATDQQRTYTITLQPPSGVVASFDQFLGFDGASAPLTSLSVVIPRLSSAARTVFVGFPGGVPPATPPHVLVPVSIQETSATNGATDMVFLNPDFDNPDFDNPDFDNVELHNPDFDNPDFVNPDFDNPDFDNFTLNMSIRNPDFDNPDFDNPDFDNPDFDNVNYANPDFDNPDFDNPDFDNPDFDNPDFDNPDFDNASVADITWPIYNKGNTTSAYKINVNLNNPPAGVRYQLIVRRVYPSPKATNLCAPAQSAQNQAIVNIMGPNVQANLRDRNFNDPNATNATFSLAPHWGARITLRAYCTTGDCMGAPVPLGINDVALAVVAQAANCIACTGSACTSGDQVIGGSECVLSDGLPPKDIYDPIPPVITGPATTPTATDADNNGTEPVAFTVTATDNVQVGQVACQAGVLSLPLTATSGSQYSFAGTFPVGTTVVTCTASDVRTVLGVLTPNTSSVSFSVVVNDVTPPTFDFTGSPGAPFVPSNPAEATGPAGAVVTYTTPSATDSNGGPVTVACTPVSGSTFGIGTTPVPCVATDQYGNSTPPTTLFTVAVRDTTPPTIAPAPNVTAEATSASGAIVTYASPTWTDAVSGSGSTTCAPASGSQFALGTTTVTCSVTDGAGNPASSTFTVTVRDTTAPVIGASANITVEATSAGGAVVTYTSPSWTDAVSGTGTATCAPAAGSTFPLGTTTVTCSTTDAAGNSATTTFTVTVRDTTAPTLTLPAPMTVAATSLSGATVTYTVSASDLVDGSVAVACSPASGSTFPIGTTTVNCTAKDRSGNSTSGSFSVTVKLTYGFVGVQNLPPPPTKTFNPGSSIPQQWQFTVGGVAVDSSSANPKITVQGPYSCSGSPSGATQTFTQQDPGKSSFRLPTASNGWTWQFNWQTVDATGKNLPAGCYATSVTSQLTGQTFGPFRTQLK